MKFYRYQGRTEMDTESRYVDLEMLKEDFNAAGDALQRGLTDSELFNDEKLFKKYKDSLSLRKEISARDLFNLVKGSPENDIELLCYKYPIKGVFGELKEDIDSNYSFEELLKECPWHCDDEKYLIVYEGDLISNEGDLGYIFRPEAIDKIYELNK